MVQAWSRRTSGSKDTHLNSAIVISIIEAKIMVRTGINVVRGIFTLRVMLKPAVCGVQAVVQRLALKEVLGRFGELHFVNTRRSRSPNAEKSAQVLSRSLHFSRFRYECDGGGTNTQLRLLCGHKWPLFRRFVLEPRPEMCPWGLNYGT
jgi:hypothetical protein